MVKNLNDSVVYDIPKNIVPSVIQGSDLYTAFCHVKAYVDDLATKVEEIEDYPELKARVLTIESSLVTIQGDVQYLDNYISTHNDDIGSIPTLTRRVEALYDEIDSVRAQMLQIRDTDLPNIRSELQEAEDSLSQLQFTVGQHTSRLESLGADMQNKLDKKTSTGLHVYTHNGATQNEQSASENATASTVAIRHAGGRLTVGAPTANDDAATKKYVDDHAGGGNNYNFVYLDADFEHGTVDLDGYTAAQFHSMMSNNTDGALCVVLQAFGNTAKFLCVGVDEWTNFEEEPYLTQHAAIFMGNVKGSAYKLTVIDAFAVIEELI